MNRRQIWTICCFSILVIGLVRSVAGINCFVCNSHDDPGCDTDPVDSKYKTDCVQLLDGHLYDRCRKATQFFSVPQYGNSQTSNVRIIRSCGWAQWSDLDDQGCREKPTLSGRQVVCSCNTNNCNGASSVTCSVLTIIGIVTLALYLLVRDH